MPGPYDTVTAPGGLSYGPPIVNFGGPQQQQQQQQPNQLQQLLGQKSFVDKLRAYLAQQNQGTSPQMPGSPNPPVPSGAAISGSPAQPQVSQPMTDYTSPLSGGTGNYPQGGPLTPEAMDAYLLRTYPTYYGGQ